MSVINKAGLIFVIIVVYIIFISFFSDPLSRCTPEGGGGDFCDITISTILLPLIAIISLLTIFFASTRKIVKSIPMGVMERVYFTISIITLLGYFFLMLFSIF